MKKESRDLRVQRTKRLIFEAFSSMLKEMDYQTITVKELTSRAGISRKTFYLHYDFLEELRKDFIESIALELVDLVRSAGDEENVLSAVFLFFYEHGDFVSHVYRNRNRGILQEALLLASRKINHVKSNAELPVDRKYIIAALLNYFLLWYDETDHSGAEEASHHIARMLLDGVKGKNRDRT